MKPFLQGRKVLAVEPLRLPAGSAVPRTLECTAGKTGGPAAEPSNATVEVIKEGDKVMRLAITCACGERIEIDCLYPVGS